jgi:hypothetical protein
MEFFMEFRHFVAVVIRKYLIINDLQHEWKSNARMPNSG